jgi:hypothetical protein
MPLDPNFPLYTPGARRLYHFEQHEDQALLTTELKRTHEALAATLMAKIDKGQLTEEEAAALAGPRLAIIADLEAQDAWLAAGGGASGWSLAEKLRELHRENRVTWATKVGELRREIEGRRIAYPAMVEKGTLTQDQAKQQLDAVEAVHDLYWRLGYAFDGTREELRAYGEVILDHPLHDEQAAAA